MQLLVQYLGGEQTMIAHLEVQVYLRLHFMDSYIKFIKERIKHLWPFNNRLRPIATNR